MTGTMRFEDRNWPPIGREEQGVDPLETVVLHAEGREVYDPNGVIIASFPNLPADLPEQFRSVKRFASLRPVDGETSVLSGEPAVVLLEDDARIPLTPDEVSAWGGRSLRPDEYMKLRERYGLLFPIHDDFYDPRTGIALDPNDPARAEPLGIGNRPTP